MIKRYHIMRTLYRHIPAIIAGWVLAVLLSFSFHRLPIALPNTLNSEYLRYDSHIQHTFLEHIAQTDGILVLGTSETSSGAEGTRYWEIGDVQGHTMYGLSGAGRASHTWIPMMLKYHDLFKGMSVLYYANPVYYTRKLNTFHKDYYDRYIGLTFLNSIAKEDIPENIWAIHQRYTEQYRSVLVGQTIYPKALVSDYMDTLFSRANEHYKVFLKGYLAPPAPTMPYTMAVGTLREHELQSAYDPNVNIRTIWADRFAEGLGPISDDLFAVQALKDFITVAQWAGIKLTVFVGPYNKRLGLRRSPEQVPKYEQVQNQIIHILQDQGIPYIDGTVFNNQYGFFKDQMHMSDDLGHEYVYHALQEGYREQ